MLRFLFLDRSDAARSLRSDAWGATLALPLPPSAPVSDAMSVRFESAGRDFEAVGLSQTEGGVLYLRFEGPEAEVAREALAESVFPMTVCAQRRFACCLPVTVLGPQKLVRAVACDLGPGGARILGLSAPLQRGAEVKVRLGEITPAVRAKVAWCREGASAGLAFAAGEATAAIVSRALAEVLPGSDRKAG